MELVRKAVQHLNAGLTPLVAFDQLLYAIAKQIQWKWPEMYGEDTLVVMFDAMNIMNRFVILLFDRTSTCTKVDYARRKLFQRNKLGAANPAYPSCSRGARQESSRPGWLHLGEDPVLPPPTEGGWGKTEGINEPHWTTLPQATKSCHELVSCGCKSGCKTVLQVQEGCTSVHRSLLLWGRMCQLTLRSLIYSDIKVPRNDPWEVVKLSRDHDVLMNNWNSIQQ